MHSGGSASQGRASLAAVSSDPRRGRPAWQEDSEQQRSPGLSAVWLWVPLQPLPPRGPDRTWLRDSWRSPGPGSAQQRDPLNPLPQSTGFLLGDGEGTPGGCGWTIPITPWSSSWSWGGRGRGLGNHWGRPQPSGLPLTSCEFRTHPPTWEVTGLPD